MSSTSIGSSNPRPAPVASSGAISVDHLGKRYGGRDAVNDLTFSVSYGEIFALLGPNGAGKTTTVEILEGYRTADRGAVSVLGLDPLRQGTVLKPQIGVMLQQDGLYPSLKAAEVLQLYSKFFDNPESPVELLHRVGLGESAAVRCRQLSGGQKRRLALAVALVGRPKVLFLDEPTTGMDPQARRATWDIIREVKESGATVLLTTHFMDEAERLADRIAIIDGGKLIAQDTPAGLTRSQSTTTTEVYFSVSGDVNMADLGRVPSARGLRSDGPGNFILETGDPRTALMELAQWARDHQLDISSVRVGRSSLEDVFLRLTGKEIRE